MFSHHISDAKTSGGFRVWGLGFMFKIDCNISSNISTNINTANADVCRRMLRAMRASGEEEEEELFR